MRKSVERWGWVVGGIGCALVAIQPAQATTITYESYTVDDNTTVTINDSALGVSNEVGGSGLINFYSGPNGTGTLVAELFCVDITHWLASSGTFTIIPAVQHGTSSNITTNGTPGAGSHISWATLGEIGELINLGYEDPGNSSQIQIAIWELEDGSDSGFSISPSADITTLLADASALGLTPDPYIDWLVDCAPGIDCNQGQAGITGGGGTNNFPTPEPATILEFLGALGVLGGFVALRRRRDNLRARIAGL